MGRREDREHMQSTWSIYVPQVAQKPFRKKDIEDADERASAEERASAGVVAPPQAERQSGALLDLRRVVRASRNR